MKELFVVPFAFGALFLFICLAVYWIRWFGQFDVAQRKLIARCLISLRSVRATGEVVRECLFHGRLWIHNARLGMMHTCFAAGWFLLIVVGHVQVAYDSGSLLHAPWYVIFYRWYVPLSPHTLTNEILEIVMNLLLLVMLIGVCMAVVKRFYVRLFGLKKNTRPAFIDLIPLWSLWCIFPLRFLAESMVVAANNEGGGPLTMFAGQFLESFLPADHLVFVCYALYSLSLGVFFVMLPFTRYMHIFTEIPLVYLRHWGICAGQKNDGMAQFQIHACSSCGVCVTECQLTALKRNNSQPAYFHRYLRRGSMPAHHLYNCLQCGRCKTVCPVGIETTQLRMNEWQTRLQTLTVNHSYLPKPQVKPATRVAYFQGCMGHLTPSVSRAMSDIFTMVKQEVIWIDADRSICCGRPMQRTGMVQQAKQLQEMCVEYIKACNAEVLVTACPICYRQFAQMPELGTRVLHHTQYLHELLSSGELKLSPLNQTAVYHDPCELSRQNDAVYEAPRAVLQKMVRLQQNDFERNNALCCGASLANTDISSAQRNTITQQVVSDLLKDGTEVLVTSCNLCKKTLQAQSPVAVKDIAELVRDSIVLSNNKTS